MQYPAPFAPWTPGDALIPIPTLPGTDTIDFSYPLHPDQIDDLGNGIGASPAYVLPNGAKVQWFCTGSEYGQWMESIWYVGGSKNDSRIWPYFEYYQFYLPVPEEWGGAGRDFLLEEQTQVSGSLLIYYPNDPPIGDWENIENPLAPFSQWPWEKFGAGLLSSFPADYWTGWHIRVSYELMMWTKKPNVGVSPVIPLASLIALNWLKKRKTTL